MLPGVPCSSSHAIVPLRAADGRMDDVRPGNNAFVAAEADRQVSSGSATDCHSLQHRLIVHRILKNAEALMFWKQGAHALR